MAEWAARIAPWRERWAKLGLATRVAIAAAALMALGALAFATSTPRTPEKAVLFSNLSDDDAARIVEKLRGANIPYEFGSGNTTLLVSEKQVHETRLMLASEGLPSGGGVGFEVFDQQRFGESEFSEQVKYHRALEGELARTISHLAGVKRARVHLVLPTRSLFADNAQDASASVVVHLVPGWKMREDQVKGIVHLVASSVRGLDPDKVTLVDGDGRSLERPSQDEGELANKADTYRREIEKSKERAAQQMLDTTYGQGKTMVRVAAAVSFTREEVTEERYDPQTIAQRSFQIIEEREGAGNKTVGGLPGTPSNLPGGEASATGPGGGSAITKRSETRNYEVSKVMRRAVEPVGRVTGLQVAVVTDGRYKVTGEKRKFEPLSQDELDRIQKLVAGAVGVDDKRGDRVIVECIPFALPNVPPDDRSVLERAVGPYSNYVMYAAMAALALVAYVMLTRTMKKRELPAGSPADVLHALNLANAARSGESPALSPGAPAELNPLNALGGAQAAGALPQPAEPGPSSEELHAAAAAAAAAALPMLSGKKDNDTDNEAIEKVRQLASEMASKEPEAAARILRGWLADAKTEKELS